MPANPGDQPKLTYPVGAVEYLQQAGFTGNAMVSFTVGGYVIWELAPQVKVSIDGRFETAYPNGALEENYGLYMAKPGWQNVLSKYPTDVILVPTAGKLAPVMPDSGWNRVYRDEAYEVYARPGLTLPNVDRREQHLVGHFP